MEQRNLPLVIACIAKSPWYGRTDYEAGWFNAYVLIRKDLNSVLRAELQDTDLDDWICDRYWLNKIVFVHGGITLGDSKLTEETFRHMQPIIFDKLNDEYAIIENYTIHGFDFAHCNDTAENCPIELVDSAARDCRRQVYDYVINHDFGDLSMIARYEV